MTIDLPGMRRELRPMLGLALPVVLGELAWMSLGVVDTVMVGRLDAEALGAVSVGRAVFMSLGVLGIGLLLGLDTLVSQAFGAGRLAECRRWLWDGLWLAGLAGVPATILLLGVSGGLRRIGLDPEVAERGVGYLRAVSFSLLPLLAMTALRRYLQAMNIVRPVMVALVSANVINAFGNWVLVFGNLGAPRMGAVGAGWATVLSSVYMAAFLAVVARLESRGDAAGAERVSKRFDPRRAWRLVRLGFPVMVHFGLELGVFALATLLAGRLAPAALAAHHIALTAASVTFMVPLGCSTAGAVRVGQALGREDAPGAARAGWTALALGSAFMSLAALTFLLVPHAIVRLFTDVTEVVTVGVSLLAVAAMFQLFDGLQVVATGILRGTGDTRTPVLWNLIGHWLVGLPLGTWLCFGRGLGVVGLWIGLASGLMFVGVVLLGVWARRARAFLALETGHLQGLS